MERKTLSRHLAEEVGSEVSWTENTKCNSDSPVPLSQMLADAMEIKPTYKKKEVTFSQSQNHDEVARYEYTTLYDNGDYLGLILWLEIEPHARSRGLSRPLRQSMLTDMGHCDRIYTRIDNTAIQHIALDQGFRQITEECPLKGWFVREN